MNGIDLIPGARRNFMKVASIIDALQAAKAHGSLFRYRAIPEKWDGKAGGRIVENLERLLVDE